MTDVVLPAGFVAAGVACGIKPSGAPDLALFAAEPARSVAAAGVFTQNLAAAAPVRLSRAHLAATAGRAGAVVVNSGCANAATGPAGELAAARMAECCAAELGLSAEEVLVCSTGVIGTELPVSRVEAGIAAAAASRSGASSAAGAAARAMMTTDTREKLASVLLPSGARVVGLAKGAAMLAPNMATMLAIVTTDAPAGPGELDTALRHAVDRSFNELSIDGCTSTNDTVLALSSGAFAGARETSPEALSEAFTVVCRDLAHQMAADAEGGTKVVTVVVDGAVDDVAARRAARRVAEAPRVKCSWYGADPNWGRIVSELASAGTPFDLAKVAVSYGPHAVCRKGAAAVHDDEALAAYLAGPEIEVRCELGLGDGHGEILSADLTHGYIDENMGLS